MRLPLSAFADVIKLDSARAKKPRLSKKPRAAKKTQAEHHGFTSRAQARTKTSTGQAPQQRSRGPAGPRPLFTYGLLGCMALVYLIQNLLGSDSTPVVAIAMGSNLPKLALGAEPWRLFSSGLLHGNILHLAANSYVLFSIGRFLEAVIGSWRVAIIFTAAVLGGSVLASLTMEGGQVVGASGGLFGLLVAEAVLAWRGRGILPDEFIPVARRVAVTNLLINLGISFMPGISLAGHLGGALVGCVLTLSGIIFIGVPKAGRPRSEDKAPAWVRPAAVLGCSLMILSLALAWVVGRPFALGSEPQLKVHTTRGIDFLAPGDLHSPQHSERNDSRDEGGTLMFDAGEWSVQFFSRATESDTHALELLRARVAQEAGIVVEDSDIETVPGGFDLHLPTAPVADYAQLHRVYVIRKKFAARIEVVNWNQYGDTWSPLPLKIAASMKVPPRGR